MSCLLDHLIAINNLEEQINWLCPSLSNEQRILTSLDHSSSDANESDWSSEWENWEEDKTAGIEGASLPGGGTLSQSWISECKIAVSPTVDYLVLGYKNRLLILASRWENKAHRDEGRMNLVQHWRGSVGHSDADEISCVLCLPLTSQRQSSAGAADWTCIVVGFTSGFVSMYTENGMLLLSQMFDIGRVLSIKCRTLGPKGSYGSYDLSEELVLLYGQSIITIDGFSLCQTLKGCLNQLAKAAASGGENVSVPPLGYKKWGLVNHQEVCDVAPVGLMPPYMYDYTTHLTVTKGTGQTASVGVPMTYQYLTVGKVPYMGFLCAKETGVQVFMADVAMLFANKLKNAIVSVASGWIFGSRKTEENEKKDQPKIEPATPLPYSSSIPDKRRKGLSLELSPDKRLSVTTDEFGRVVLIDVPHNVAIRMWKGYREAQCGWIEVKGEYKGEERRTSFLLIYAPRRGLLEVWLPQQGPRVAAFNVPKQGKLLNTSHTLLGVNSTRTVQCKMYSVVFLTPEGSLLEVNVPFHLALGGKTSKKARDLHLLKSMKQSLKEDKEDDVFTNLAEMKTTSVRTQAVSVLIASHHITTSLLHNVLNHLNNIYSVDTNKGESESCLDHEGRVLSQQLQRLTQLLHLHNTVTSLYNSTTSSNTEDNNNTVMKEKLSEKLMLRSEEIETILPNRIHKILASNNNKKNVSFESNQTMAVGSFIRSWDTFLGNIVKEPTIPIPVKLRSDLSREKRSLLGKFMFGWDWSESNMEVFKDVLKSSGVDCKKLLLLCLNHWSCTDEVDILATLHLAFIIHTLSSINVREVVYTEDDISPWWKEVRELLETWTCISNAYLAALACRGVHASLTSLNTEGCDDDDGGGGGFSLMEWEGLSMEMVEWNILINKLEKLLPLETALKYQSDDSVNTSYLTSIKLLLDRGKGYVSEVVAQWLISLGLPVSSMIKIMHDLDLEWQKIDQQDNMEVQEDTEGGQPQDDDVSQKEEEPSNSITEEQSSLIIIKDMLREIRTKFPESLQGDTILTNMAWEVGASWSKNCEDIDKFAWAVSLLQGVQNCYLRHGLGVMMWITWVGGGVQTVTQLISKAGRTPKDRICRRELGFGDHSLASYLQNASSLLDTIMEANVICEVDKPTTLATDDFWMNKEVSPALIDLTLTQNMTSYDLLVLHYQLLTVLHLATHYSLTSVKPLAYFDERGRIMLFEPLHTNFTLAATTHPPVKKGREAFLCRAITAVVSNMPDDLPFTQFTMLPLREIIDLARSWGTNLDPLHRHHGCQLYTNGHDEIAKAVRSMINDDESYGSQLLMIGGLRLSYLLSNSSHKTQIMLLTSPIVLKWAQSLDYSEIKYSLKKEHHRKTTNMLKFTHRVLAEGSHEKYMAYGLVDTFEAILRYVQEEG